MPHPPASVVAVRAQCYFAFDLTRRLSCQKHALDERAGEPQASPHRPETSRPLRLSIPVQCSMVFEFSLVISFRVLAVRMAARSSTLGSSVSCQSTTPQRPLDEIQVGQCACPPQSELCAHTRFAVLARTDRGFAASESQFQRFRTQMLMLQGVTRDQRQRVSTICCQLTRREPTVRKPLRI